MNNVLQKTKSNTLDKIAAERHHNSTGNRTGVIARLELLIKESQIFFSFWVVGLSSMENSNVEYTYGWYSVSVGKIWYACYNDKDKDIIRLYAENQLHLNSLTLSIIFTMWYQLYIWQSEPPCQDYKLLDPITIVHCNFPTRHNQSKPSKTH
jgi:hypothetical protein